MGSLVFQEIADFRKQQTTFTVHPRPKPLDMLSNLEKQYVGEFISPATIYKPMKEAENLVIALLDTGVYTEHLALKDKVIAAMMYDGSKELPKGEPISDTHGHGTHLAGILVADQTIVNYTLGTTTKSVTINGLLPNAKLISIRVTLDNSGTTSWSHIADGLQQVLNYNSRTTIKMEDKIKVVVLAYNAFDNMYSEAALCVHRINKLIQTLYKMGVAVVVSAGNAYGYYQPQFKKRIASGLAYPAYCKNTLVAMAHDENNMLAPFSQRIFDEDFQFDNHVFAAFGTDTISTGITSNTSASVLSGSSQAAAVLAGLYIQRLVKSGRIGNPVHPSLIINDLKTSAQIQSQVMRDAERSNYTKKFHIAK